LRNGISRKGELTTAKKASSVSMTIACALTPREAPAGFIAPLFWQYGEPPEVLREEMQKMRSAGIRQCIVESRPDYSVPLEARRFLDYAGPEWWAIMDTILDEAERLGMKIWIGDDVVFPSGYAAGRIRDRYPTC
jgi:hypothetical protein